MIIDEEQRFGVEHKDTLKKMKTNVDILAMSATPIPRTLEMAVTGIREMSTLQTPPEDRHPILSFVGPKSDKQLAAAIRREILREGQIFYVHNRVQSIQRVAAELAELVPEARIAVAHGQMGEHQLEQVVDDFWERKFDVLVSTTIIETGLDISNANTIIIDRADRYGLSQLHQLRGRVGRGARTRLRVLPVRRDEAAERDGRRPAADDRGQQRSRIRACRSRSRTSSCAVRATCSAAEQAGHIAGVGFDLYLRMIGEAVATFRGEEIETGPSCGSSCRSTRGSRSRTSTASGCGWRPTRSCPPRPRRPPRTTRSITSWKSSPTATVSRRPRCEGSSPSPGCVAARPAAGLTDVVAMGSEPARRAGALRGLDEGAAAAALPAGEARSAAERRSSCRCRARIGRIRWSGRRSCSRRCSPSPTRCPRPRLRTRRGRPMTGAEPRWRWLSTRELYRGRVRIDADEVQLPEGERITYEVDRSVPYSVATLVLLDGDVLLTPAVPLRDRSMDPGPARRRRQSRGVARGGGPARARGGARSDRRRSHAPAHLLDEPRPQRVARRICSSRPRCGADTRCWTTPPSGCGWCGCRSPSWTT